MDSTTCLEKSLTKSPYQGSSIYVNISVVWRRHGLPTSDGGGGARVERLSLPTSDGDSGGAGVEWRGITASNGGGAVTWERCFN